MPFKQDNPLIVSTTDNILIYEHCGLVATQDGEISIDYVVAPAGWSEPFQHPDFDEYSLNNSGRKVFEVDGETTIVEAGQSILIKKVVVSVTLIHLMNHAVIGVSVCPLFHPV